MQERTCCSANESEAFATLLVVFQKPDWLMARLAVCVSGVQIRDSPFSMKLSLSAPPGHVSGEMNVERTPVTTVAGWAKGGGCDKVRATRDSRITGQRAILPTTVARKPPLCGALSTVNKIAEGDSETKRGRVFFRGRQLQTVPLGLSRCLVKPYTV